MKKNKVHSFAKGAFILTLGMLTVKILGAVFKVPLMSMLGGEGSGYFTGAYNLYCPIYALATAGLPIAISKLVSENVALKRFKNVRKIYEISSPIFFITGAIGFVLIIFGAFVYSNIAKAPGAIYSIFMLAPTLFFSCLMSTYRGYYEGLRNMTPTATSEVIESFGKVIFGLFFTYLVMQLGWYEFNLHGTVFGKFCQDSIVAEGVLLPYASAAAVLGIAISSVFGFLYMFLRHKIKSDGITTEQIENSPDAKPKKELFKELLSVAAPVGLGAIIMNLAGVIDSILIQRRLADVAASNLPRLISVYGNLLPKEAITRGNVHIFLSGCFGFTSTVTMFLPTISQGIAISALPTVTAAWTVGIKEKMKKNIEKIIKLTSVVSIPMGFGLSVLAQPIMDLIYNTFNFGTQNGEVQIGAGIMAVSGIGSVFIALSTPICSMLQAIGRADLPVKILSIGVVIKVLLNYILVGVPEINIQGAGIGTLACYVFVFLSSLVFLCKITKININLISVFIKPAIAAVFCAIAAITSYNLMCYRSINNKIATIFAIIISACVYFLAVFALRTFNTDELQDLPFLSVFFNKIKKTQKLKF